MGKGLEVRDLCKSFGTEDVLQNITFALEERKIGTVVGPSGAGKTTLLNVIAGITAADSGIVSIGGVVVESAEKDGRGTHVRSAERKVGYVFQDYLLFPHMSVFENVAYGLRARHLPKQSVKEQVVSVLDLIGLQDIREKKPAQISGGQMQRVALARALVLEPRVLLMDEPLSALDRQTREALRMELKRTFDTLQTTVLYVTHDLDEAFFFGQEIGIMGLGTFSFFPSKTELLSRMSSSTADFMGFNLVRTRLLELAGSDCVFLVHDFGSRVKITMDDVKLSPGEDAILAVPPESIRILVRGDASQGFQTTVRDIWEFKDTVQIALGDAEKRLIGEVSRSEFRQISLRRGDRVMVQIKNAFLVSDGGSGR